MKNIIRLPILQEFVKHLNATEKLGTTENNLVQNLYNEQKKFHQCI